MTAIRLLDTGLLPARRNVAMTAALVELRRLGRIPDTLRFHRYPRSVLLGRTQTARQVANLASCANAGIEIARRVTGGGAVYMSPGVLAWEIVMDRRRLGASQADIGSRICRAVAQGLSELGVAVRHGPPNDLVIGAHKLGGASGFVDGTTLLYQGTVIVEVDFDAMAAALAPAGEDIAQARQTLRERLTRLVDHIVPPPMEGVAKAIREGLAGAMGCAFEPGAPTAEECAHCAALEAAEIGSDAFALTGEAA